MNSALEGIDFSALYDDSSELDSVVGYVSYLGVKRGSSARFTAV
jgi:hypothetical protein